MGIFDKLFGRRPPETTGPAASPRPGAGSAAEEVEAPGRDAISAACRRVYPEQPDPQLFRPVFAHRFTVEPLDGVVVYRAAEPRPHWHYVTYGFSQLTGEEDADIQPDRPSGYGFELTFRLAADDALEPGATAPQWPEELLQYLASYVFETGNGFAAGHHMALDDLENGIGSAEPTELTAVCFVEDPDLGSIVTPLGSVSFLQVVGVTADELAALRLWSTAAFTELLGTRHPKGIVDPRRHSVLEDPAMRRAVEDGRRRDGSNQGSLFVQDVRLRELPDGQAMLVLSDDVAAQLLALVPARLLHGRQLWLSGPGFVVTFTPDDGRSSWSFADEDELEVTLTAAAVERLLAEISTQAGEYRPTDLPGLVIRLVEVEDL